MYRPTLNVILSNSHLVLCRLCAPAMRTLFLPFASPLTLPFPSSLIFQLAVNCRCCLGELSQDDFGFADPGFRRPSSGPRLPKDSAKRAWASLRHESGRITSHRFSTIPLLSDDTIEGNAYDMRFVSMKPSSST